MKTVKQIADELGVSKQAVHQKRKKVPLSTSLQPFTETVDGVVYISVDGENLIKQAFSKGEASAPFTPVDDNKITPVDSHMGDLVNVLQATLNNLQGQLEVKDQQIHQQAKTIQELSAALATSQALHAGTIQGQLDKSENNMGQINEKRGLFNKLFKK